MNPCYHPATSEGEMVDQRQVLMEVDLDPDDHGKLHYDPFVDKRNYYISIM
jgi:hypothetical protein